MPPGWVVLAAREGQSRPCRTGTERPVAPLALFSVPRIFSRPPDTGPRDSRPPSKHAARWWESRLWVDLGGCSRNGWMALVDPIPAIAQCHQRGPGGWRADDPLLRVG